MVYKYNRPSLTPSQPKDLTPTLHHDIYPAISPTGCLSNTAKGLKVLITGAGRGIGRGIALVFAQAGAQKLVLTSRSQGQLDEVQETIEALLGPGKVPIVKVVADIRIREDVDRLFDSAGELDVLVNNAGLCEPALPIHESDPNEWWEVQEIMIKGTYLITREFLRCNLGRSELTILNVTSVGAASTVPGHSSYQPAKTQMNRFTEFIHFEYREHNVRAFVFHPGGVHTELARYGLPESGYAYLIDTPELAGGFALWLVSQREKVEFLRGRHLSANWDVEELLALKDEIIERGLLWVRITGYQQGPGLTEPMY